MLLDSFGGNDIAHNMLTMVVSKIVKRMAFVCNGWKTLRKGIFYFKKTC